MPRIPEALVVVTVFLVIDELADLFFQITWQMIVFQWDSVFKRLMPTLDLALCLWMV